MTLRHTHIFIPLLLAVLHLCFFGAYVECNIVYYAVVALLVITSFLRKGNSLISGDVAWLYVFFLIAYAVNSVREYGSEQGFFFMSCWLCLFGLRKCLRNQPVREVLFWTIVCCSYFEIAIGFCQLFGIMGNGDSDFRLGGTFGNSGLYAGYFSIVMPFILTRLLEGTDCGAKLRYLLVLCVILMTYLIVISYSRGAWVATIVGAICVMFNHGRYLHTLADKWSRSKHKAVVACAGAIAVMCLSAGLYMMKKNSADGRLFIWKVALTTQRDSWLLGEGIGAFEANYGKWQRDYFAASHATEHERYIADYVTCAYNEFIETYKEQGVIGLLLFLLIIGTTLVRKPTEQSSMYNGAYASLIAYLALCMVSFPSHSQVMYLQLVVSIAVLQSHFKVLKKGEKAVYILILPVIVMVIYILPLLLGMIRMKEGLSKTAHGDMKGAIIEYEKASSALHNNGTYLFYYGSSLSMNDNIQKGTEILEMAQQKSSDPNIPILLGDNYLKLGDTTKAYTAYMNAINSIPMRLYPKYKMVKMLQESGRDYEAQWWAKEIIRTPVKVTTMAADEIKEEMREYLKENH